MSTRMEQQRLLDANIASAIQALAKSVGQVVNDGRRTCVHCAYFNGDETCQLAGQRPPAQVIAFGCPSFVEDEIPF